MDVPDEDPEKNISRAKFAAQQVSSGLGKLILDTTQRNMAWLTCGCAFLLIYNEPEHDVAEDQCSVIGWLNAPTILIG
ncbi:hypothetical protein ACTXT7_006822 [Hymenolepis weldensis]